MKKIMLLFSIMLLATNSAMAETSPACISPKKVLIFQVLNEGALAFTCPRFNFEYSDMPTACTINGTLVYLERNYNYVDNQIIKLQKNECFAEGGAYRYVNPKGITKTVRRISIINKDL